MWEQARPFVCAHMGPHPCRGAVHGAQFGHPRVQASTTCSLFSEQHVHAFHAQATPQMASPCPRSPVKVARNRAMSSTSSGTYTAFSPSCCSAALWMAGLRLQQRQRWMGAGQAPLQLASTRPNTRLEPHATAQLSLLPWLFSVNSCSCPHGCAAAAACPAWHRPPPLALPPVADGVAHNAHDCRVLPLPLQPVHAAQLLQRGLAGRCVADGASSRRLTRCNQPQQNSRWQLGRTRQAS